MICAEHILNQRERERGRERESESEREMRIESADNIIMGKKLSNL